jgi:hypothetical protein
VLAGPLAVLYPKVLLLCLLLRRPFSYRSY